MEFSACANDAHRNNGTNRAQHPPTTARYEKWLIAENCNHSISPVEALHGGFTLSLLWGAAGQEPGTGKISFPRPILCRVWAGVSGSGEAAAELLSGDILARDGLVERVF